MEETLTETTAELVVAAQGGDARAFSVLIGRFQDMAVGTALGRLGDPERARDAAQEAFVEVFLHIKQVRDPPAFGGWLRQAVRKHCDRQTRGKLARNLSFEGDALAAATDPCANAESTVQAAQQRAWVRQAIETLPEHERLVVVLFYLAEQSTRDIGEFLEIEPNTVKQRLHAARRRLAKEAVSMLEESLDAMRPSQTAGFSEQVQFFLAVRIGDIEAVRAQLARRPELVHAHELWNDVDAGGGELPPPTLAPPLLRAAARGDVAMLELLLAHGASVHGRCGCEVAELPLFEAVATAHVAAAERLLQAGADPNLPGLAGHRALHVAAIRRVPGIVPALLAHGADPSLRDANGRTAADWAKLKGHTEIVALLSHTGCPVQVSKAIAGTQAGPEPAATVTANSALWFTGIKAVDLFAPLAKGALVRVDGGAMVGRNVAIGEMCAAALRDGVPCVWGLLQDSGWQAEAVAELLAETGLEGRVEVVSAHGAAAADTDAQAGWADRVVDRAEALLAAGAGHVLVTFFDEAGHRAELEAVLPRLGATGGGFITCLLVTRWQAFDGQANALKLPFDAVLAFDLGLALVHHFPAIHPLHTGSRCLGDSALDVEHIDLAKRAQALLAAYRDGLPSLTPQDLEQLDVRKREAFAGCRVPIPNFQPEPTGRVAHSLDGLQQARAQRLMAFLTQPFHQTEFASGQPGASVGRGDLLRGVRAILNGECDQLAPGALLYRGVLPT